MFLTLMKGKRITFVICFQKSFARVVWQVLRVIHVQKNVFFSQPNASYAIYVGGLTWIISNLAPSHHSIFYVLETIQEDSMPKQTPHQRHI